MFTKWLSKLLMVFAIEFEKFEDRVTALRRESIPGLSRELLSEWERDLGLPDQCSPLAPTIDERQRIVHAKYTGNYYGQSRQFFIDYAESLGATITVHEFTGTGSIFRVDINRVDSTPPYGIDGSRLWSSAAKHRLAITILNIDGDVSEQYIMCRINQIKPAHVEIVWY